MAYLELSNPTSDSCDYEIELSSAFNQSYYTQVRLTTTNYGDSASNISSYVVYKNAPSSGASKYVRGIIDDGMSAGRTYRFYAYAQAANGTWYKAGTDTITMEELDEEEGFDYGFKTVEIDTPAPYEIGDTIKVYAQIKNYLNTAGPRYVIEVRDRGGKLVDRVPFPKINAKKTVDVYFHTTLKADQVQSNKVKYELYLKADVGGWKDTDDEDNEKTLTVNVKVSISDIRIYDDISVTGSIKSGEETWYYVVFDEDGKANFALQPQKASLDVDLDVYASNKTTRLGRSRKGEGQDDIVSDIEVIAGERYYIKVTQYSGSGKYIIRCKNYPEATILKGHIEEYVDFKCDGVRVKIPYHYGGKNLPEQIRQNLRAGATSSAQYQTYADNHTSLTGVDCSGFVAYVLNETTGGAILANWGKKYSDGISAAAQTATSQGTVISKAKDVAPGCTIRTADGGHILVVYKVVKVNNVVTEIHYAHSNGDYGPHKAYIKIGNENKDLADTTQEWIDILDGKVVYTDAKAKNLYNYTLMLDCVNGKIK